MCSCGGSGGHFLPSPPRSPGSSEGGRAESSVVQNRKQEGTRDGTGGGVSIAVVEVLQMH